MSNDPLDNSKELWRDFSHFMTVILLRDHCRRHTPEYREALMKAWVERVVEGCERELKSMPLNSLISKFEEGRQSNQAVIDATRKNADAIVAIVNQVIDKEMPE